MKSIKNTPVIDICGCQNVPQSRYGVWFATVVCDLVVRAACVVQILNNACHIARSVATTVVKFQNVFCLSCRTQHWQVKLSL